jgi:hypothetical protein
MPGHPSFETPTFGRLLKDEVGIVCTPNRRHCAVAIGHVDDEP